MARPHTIVKNIASLTSAEIQTCRRLNMGDMGSMKSRFNTELKYVDNGVDRGIKVILHYDRYKRVDGWGIVWYDHRKKPNVYFYVRQAARRQGVGTKLMRRAFKLNRELVVHPWDDTSKSFFRNNTVYVAGSRRMYG